MWPTGPVLYMYGSQNTKESKEKTFYTVPQNLMLPWENIQQSQDIVNQYSLINI